MRNRPTLVFAVGDRVRLRADGAENWIDQKLRLRALRGIPATVTAIVGTALSPRERSYRIEFDRISRLAPITEVIPMLELEVTDA